MADEGTPPIDHRVVKVEGAPYSISGSPAVLVRRRVIDRDGRQFGARLNSATDVVEGVGTAHAIGAVHGVGSSIASATGSTARKDTPVPLRKADQQLPPIRAQTGQTTTISSGAAQPELDAIYPPTVTLEPLTVICSTDRRCNGFASSTCHTMIALRQSLTRITEKWVAMESRPRRQSSLL